MKKLIIIIVFLFGMNLMSVADDSALISGDYKKAYIEYINALNNENSALNNLNMCHVTHFLNDYKRAKLYCYVALNILDTQKKPDMELKSNVLSKMGYLYTNTHNRKIPFDYYNEAKNIKESNPDTDKFELSRLYLNMGYEYILSDNLNMAEEYWNKSISIAEKESDIRYKYILAIDYLDLAVVYCDKKKDYETAKIYANKAIENIEALGDMQNLRIKGLAYNAKYHAYYFSKDKKDKQISAKSYYNSRLILDSLFINNFDEKYLYEIPSNDEIEAILKEFPYDNAGNYYMLIKNLKDDNIDAAEKNEKMLLNVNKESSLRYLFIAKAYANAFVSNKNYIYSQRANMYLSKFLKANNNKNLIDYLYSSAFVYLDLGNINKAEKYFNLKIKTEDNTDIVYEQIANKYIECYERTKKSKYAKKAVKYMKKIKQNVNNL